MASPKLKDVYIPMCDRDRCKSRLQKLSKALEEKHLACVIDTNLFGKFSRQFKEEFENCEFTIIHRCNDLWTKIKEFEQQMSDKDIKVLLIDMSTKTKRDKDQYSSSEGSLRSFFAKYFVTVVDDDQSRNTLVARVMDSFAARGVVPRFLPDASKHQLQEKHNGLMQVAEDEDDDTEVTFVPYPDMFGHNSVLVRQSLVKCTENEMAKFSDLRLHGWAEWREGLNTEKSSPHSEFLVHKAVQDLFERKKIVELACIASCCETVLQGEAMMLFQHLLLSMQDDGEKLNLKTQIELESLLFTGLVSLCERFLNDEDKRAAVPIQRLTVLYMLVLSDMVLSCSNKEQMQMCYMHLGTVLARCSTLDPILTVRERSSTIDKVHELRVFIEDVNRKECSIVKKTVRNFIEANSPEKLGKTLGKENTAVQACVIVETMKQMFKSLNTKNLELLLHYVESQNNKVAENNNQPSACMTLLINCLTVYIAFGLKNMKHQDLQLTSEKALKILLLYLKRSLTEDMYRHVQILLFDCNPIIQKKIFQERCSVEGSKSKKKSYDKDQLPFLLNQLERLLSPLLLVEPVPQKEKSSQANEDTTVLPYGKMAKQKALLPDNPSEANENLTVLVHGKITNHKDLLSDKSSLGNENTTVIADEKMTNQKVLLPGISNEGKFVLAHGKMSNQKVFLRVHCPHVKSHRDRNEIGGNVSEDVFYNEMIMLKKLQHKNIIKLFAFHEGHIPQFYIVENHLQNNLQTALKYKRENKDFFKQATIIKFLLDTAAALQYCHSKQYVHCNLTAESLFIVNNSTVKLCGFHLCLELVNGHGKIDEKKTHLVPIRWTAPESLKDREYTLASDIWMFGHLMYEVLSHGQLPYALTENVQVLTREIIGIICLPEEPCFRRDHYKLISECAECIPKNRPHLSDIQNQLDSFYTKSPNTEEPGAAVYSRNSYHKPSTENEKGIPDSIQSEYVGDQVPGERMGVVDISDTIQRFTLADEFIFHEKIVNDKTQNMTIMVESGKLSDIFGGVKIHQSYGDVLQIEFHLPRSCQDSLLQMALSRTLGASLQPYLDCLLQVAFVLKKLHDISWVFGDMCASNLYMDQQGQSIKVYVVSLAYMLPQGAKVVPEDTRVCARAAPEVIPAGTFSPESDVYCFGHLIWEVLVAFDHHARWNLEQFMINMESRLSTPDEEYKKKLTEKWEASHEKPQCCPDSLFNLITSCVNSASTRRITLSQVIQQLQRIRHDLNGDGENQDSRETPA